MSFKEKATSTLRGTSVNPSDLLSLVPEHGKPLWGPGRSDASGIPTIIHRRTQCLNLARSSIPRNSLPPLPAGDVGRGLSTPSGQKKRKIDTNSVLDEDVETLPGTAPASAGVGAGTLM